MPLPDMTVEQLAKRKRENVAEIQPRLALDPKAAQFNRRQCFIADQIVKQLRLSNLHSAICSADNFSGVIHRIYEKTRSKGKDDKEWESFIQQNLPHDSAYLLFMNDLLATQQSQLPASVEAMDGPVAKAENPKPVSALNKEWQEHIHNMVQTLRKEASRRWFFVKHDLKYDKIAALSYLLVLAEQHPNDIQKAIQLVKNQFPNAVKGRNSRVAALFKNIEDELFATEVNSEQLKPWPSSSQS